MTQKMIYEEMKVGDVVSATSKSRVLRQQCSVVTSLNARSLAHAIFNEFLCCWMAAGENALSCGSSGPRRSRRRAVGAMDTRHVEKSTYSRSLMWQKTESEGYIQQTLHLPEGLGSSEPQVPDFGLGWVNFDFNVVAQAGQAVHQLALRQVGEVAAHHV